MLEDEEELPKQTGWTGLGEGSSESESGETLAIPNLSGRKASFFSSSGHLSQRSLVNAPSTHRGSFAIAASNRSSFSMAVPPTSSTLNLHANSSRLSFAAPSQSPVSAAHLNSNIVEKKDRNNKTISTLIIPEKRRTGPTVLRPGQTPRHYLHGETRTGAYHADAGSELQGRRQSGAGNSSWVG